MRRKGGVKIGDWQRTDIKKDGEGAGVQVGRRTQKSCGGWSTFFLKHSQPFNNLHLSF